MPLFGRKQHAETSAADEFFRPLAETQPRVRTHVLGQVFRLKLRPSAGLPSLEVTITDDSGSVTVIWTGRRAIAGIALGRRIIVTGVPIQRDGGLVFLNPWYQLL